MPVIPSPPDGPPSRLLRAGALSLTALASAAVLAVSGAGYGLLAWSDSSIHRVDAFAAGGTRPKDTSGTTFLLVGSDARTGMSARAERRLHVGTVATAAGRRADTMLLVHIPADDNSVTVVSLPRDSYVPIPAHLGVDGTRVPERGNKLNAAYSAGGPPLVTATVQRATGLRIDHYVEVDFLGFERLVDAIGGVDVCAPTALRDRKAGLQLPAGRSHVDGRVGLSYVRARSLDGRADLGRIERQQRFLAAMVHRLTSREVLLDPRALVRFLDAALGSVRTDPGLRRRELVDLATRLRHVPGGEVRFLTVPVADPWARPGGGVGAVALWDEPAARALFDGLRHDSGLGDSGLVHSGLAHSGRAASAQPSTPRVSVAPALLRVQVFNGVGTPGLGSRAARDLALRGFDVVGQAANWTTLGASATVIRYDGRYSESIKTLVAALPGARLEKVAGLGRTMQVVVGSTYSGVRAVQAATAQGGAGSPAATIRTAADRLCG